VEKQEKSMQAITFLKELEKFPNPVISLNDVAKIISKNKVYTRVYIHRLKSKNLLQKIERGKYALSDDPFEIGSSLVFPSYISFISAYAFYGLTTQIPTTIHVVSPRSKNPIILENTKIVFVSFKMKRIFGYRKKRVREKEGFIADPEKAIIDSLYLPQYCPSSETYEALKSDELKETLLIEYALKMDSIVVLKRLGYLLEIQGKDIHPHIKHKLNARYDKLNPLLEKGIKSSTKWKLNINEEFA